MEETPEEHGGGGDCEADEQDCAGGESGGGGAGEGQCEEACGEKATAALRSMRSGWGENEDDAWDNTDGA